MPKAGLVEHLSARCERVDTSNVINYYSQSTLSNLSGRSEKEVEDEVDSDFDIDETDEVKSDHEEADDKRPRRSHKGVVTKAYKVHTLMQFLGCLILW